MSNREEQIEDFKKYLIENRENLITLMKHKHSYVTFNKSKVENVELIVNSDGSFSRIWFNNGLYEDFPNHSKEELERVIIS